MKTNELTGAALDWAVAKCEGQHIDGVSKPFDRAYLYFESGYNERACHETYTMYSPSTEWSQGGPIIEREGIELLCNRTAIEAARFKDAHADWQAFYRTNRTTEGRKHGHTPLIAAMRCYVASKLGDQVEVPEKLT